MTSARTPWPSKPTTTNWTPSGCSGCTRPRLDATAGAVQLDNGTTIHADGIVVATGARARSLARLGGPRRSARVADDRRRHRAAPRPTPRGAAGRDRRRIHRSRSRFHRSEIGSGCRGGRGRACTAGRPARRATRRRGGTAAHRARHPAVVRGCVAGLVGSDRVTGVELADGRRLAADVVLVGIGAIPNIEWLRDSPTRAGQRCRVRRGRGNLDPERGRGRRLRGLARAVGRLAPPRRALDRRAGAPGHRGRHVARRRTAQRRPGQTAVLLVRPVRPPDPVRRHRRSRRRRSPSRWAICATPASWPCTGAGVNRSPCWAWTSRGCSPAGAASWPSSRFRPDSVSTPRHSRGDLR